MKNAQAFFAYARARYQIFLDREAGLPEPWTRDKILGRFPFCNVFREDDRTTRWFATHVRDQMRKTNEVLLATVVFRMFNRISTGEAIFCDNDLLGGFSAFSEFAVSGDVRVLRRAILSRQGKVGPFVTGAYIISSPPGYTKLDGVLEVLRRFYREKREWDSLGAGVIGTMGWEGEEGAAQLMRVNRGEDWMTLEAAWEWLRKFDYLGKFHSYEIVTDLRHTALLERAPDIMTWASPGPGARRGMNRVMGLDYRDKTMSRAVLIDNMRSLLSLSRDARMWPQGGKVTRELAKNALLWKKWEMREVEHTLCEFDKYERMRLGQGKMKRKFR